jgi:ABC-type Fe3+ transport system substrate-binding protein
MMTGHSPEVQRLLAAAKEKGEREMNFTWSEESFSGAAGAKIFESAFNKMYGTSIQIHFTPGPSMTQMAGKVTQEVAAGRSPSTDILLGTESHYSSLLGRKVLEEYDYTRLSPRIRKDVVAPNGAEIGGIISGILYNTNLISPSEAPRRLEDALNPKWKGKIASTTNAGIFDRVAARPEWGPEKMIAYVKKLSTTSPG